MRVVTLSVDIRLRNCANLLGGAIPTIPASMGEIGQAVPKLHPKKGPKKLQEMGHFAGTAYITALKY